MRWDERQRAMLAEMGIRLWLPDADADAEIERQGAIGSGAPPTSEGDLPSRSAPAVNPAPRAPAPRRIPEQRRTPVSGGVSDWSALVEEAAACTACALCAGRTRSVFEAGDRQADWMFVGDAPDADDDRAGAPFSASSGQLLDRMLEAIGLARSSAAPERRAYLTQAVKCHPPGERVPERSEVTECRRFLEQQMLRVKPRVIVAMGRVAAQGLLESSEPLGRLRGRVHHWRDVPVIATHAPAYLLRHSGEKAGAWEDLCLAVETVRKSRIA